MIIIIITKIIIIIIMRMRIVNIVLKVFSMLMYDNNNSNPTPLYCRFEAVEHHPENLLQGPFL